MKLVIVDRDGVINEAADSIISNPGAWQPIAGSLDAIARLGRAGYRVVVATNQPGIASGLLSLETLHAIHRKMHAAMAETGGMLDAIFFCPHEAKAGCDCHMPAPGLLLEIATRFRLALSGVPFITHSHWGMQTAMQAGAKPVLVRTGRGSHTETQLGPDHGHPVFDNLAQAVDHWLLSNQSLEAEV